MKRDILYKFCKNYTKIFEECEKETLEIMQEYAEKGYTEEKIREEVYESGLMDSIFSKTDMHEAGLKAYIVDDFVKMLDEDLQGKIILQCMEMKTGMQY